MWFPNWRKRPWRNLDLMIIGICNVLAGCLMICSLGFYDRNLALNYVGWRMRKWIAWELKKETMHEIH